MFKALTPIIGIIVAVGLFFTYIQPTFKDVKVIQDETAAYAQATEKASELKQRITELKQKQSTISLGNLERLEALLPDRIDEVAMLVDLDALAKTHHLSLGDIKIGDQTSTTVGEKDTKTQSGTGPGPGPVATSAGISPMNASSLATNPANQDSKIRAQYSALDISFSVSGVYNDFRLFLRDIERSLVLMEVTKITFVKSEKDLTPFMVTVRLYSLNQSTPATQATSSPNAPTP